MEGLVIRRRHWALPLDRLAAIAVGAAQALVQFE